MHIKDSNIAIIHDWFLKKSFGGSEKVTMILNDFLNKNFKNKVIKKMSFIIK